MKSIIKIFSIFISLLLLTACALSVSAQDIGTFEQGIKPGGINYSQYSPLFEFETFPNADFEQGFKYWQSDDGDYPSRFAKIKEENGNHFVELNSDTAWSNICTVRFHVPQLDFGKSYALLYDWRSEEEVPFHVNLIQWSVDKDNLHGRGVRMGYSDGDLLIPAKDGGFNTSMAVYNHPTVEKLRVNDMDKVYFSYSLQIANVINKPVQFDNLKLCWFDDKSGTITDFSGKVLFEGVQNKGSTLRPVPQTSEAENPPIYDTFPKYSFWDKLGFFFEDYGIIIISAIGILAVTATVIIIKKHTKSKKIQEI